MRIIYKKMNMVLHNIKKKKKITRQYQRKYDYNILIYNK